MTPFVIPSIFTAIDKLTSPVRAMGNSVQRFGKSLRDGVVDQVKNTIGPLALLSAIVGGIVFSTDSLMKYEDAVASFRTIVSDLTDKEFSAYQDKINAVAKDTNRSSIEVAQSFEKIAGLNATFAETSEGIGAVSKAAITLAKASRMDLGTSAENLVGIMNQFNLGALESDRAINVLAAGQAVGAASITQTAEAFKNFGSVAAGANISLEQSTALVQTLGKFSVFGAEAGTKLRGSVLKLQQAGVGYASGQFNVNDALEEAKAKIDRLATSKQKDAALNKIFGAENISTGRILLSNIDVYKKYTEGVTGTTEAQKAAEINSATLSVKLDELKNRWVNMITGSSEAGSALDGVKNVIGFLTTNLDTIVSVGGKALILFGAWKIAMITGKALTVAYNVVTGIMALVTGQATVAQWGLNTAMYANPIGIVIAIIIALIAVIVWLVSSVTGWGEQWDEVTRFMGAIWDSFRYSLLTGYLIIEHSFLMMVDAIVLAWKWGQNAIGNLSDEQFAQDKARIKEEQKLRVAAIKDAATKTAEAQKTVMQGMEWKLAWKDDAAAAETPVADRQQTFQDQLMQYNQSANVNLNVQGQGVKVDAETDNPFVNIKTSSTKGGWGK